MVTVDQNSGFELLEGHLKEVLNPIDKGGSTAKDVIYQDDGLVGVFLHG